MNQPSKQSSSKTNQPTKQASKIANCDEFGSGQIQPANQPTNQPTNQSINHNSIVKPNQYKPANKQVKQIKQAK